MNNEFDIEKDIEEMAESLYYHLVPGFILSRMRGRLQPNDEEAPSVVLEPKDHYYKKLAEETRLAASTFFRGATHGQ